LGGPRLAADQLARPRGRKGASRPGQGHHRRVRGSPLRAEPDASNPHENRG